MSQILPRSRGKRCPRCAHCCDRCFGFIGSSSRCLCCVSVRTGLLLFSLLLLTLALIIHFSIENVALLKHAKLAHEKVAESRAKFEDSRPEVSEAHRGNATATFQEAAKKAAGKLWELSAETAEEEKEALSEDAVTLTVEALHGLLDKATGFARDVKNWFATFLFGNSLVIVLTVATFFGAMFPNKYVIIFSLVLASTWAVTAGIAVLIMLPVWCCKWEFSHLISWTDVMLYYCGAICLLLVPSYFVELVASFYRIFASGGSGREMKNYITVREEMVLLDEEHKQLLLFVDSDLSSEYDDDATPLEDNIA